MLDRKLIAVCLGIAAAGVLSAADKTQWSNVQGLHAGDRIGVISSDQKRLEGEFANATESAIVVRTDREITVAKSDVVRVYRRPRLSRGKRVLIGMAAGAAVGGIIYGASGQGAEEGWYCCGTAAGVWIGGGIGVGAAAGALTGRGYETVYQITH